MGVHGQSYLTPSRFPSEIRQPFAKGCDLIATTAWVYTVSEKGDSVGSLDLTFEDSPAKCGDFGPAFPCTNEYGVLGNLCKACGPVCPPPPVNAESLGSAWGRP